MAINIVTTFYPVYEFTKRVAGDEANVNLLIGTEAADYETFCKEQLRRFRTRMLLFMKMKIWRLGFQIC